MHPSALNFGKLFFHTYCSALQGAVVHDVGAQNVNGSLRDVLPPHLGYVGIDFVAGNGVDIVLADPYKLPFADASLDVIVCSSCFEHSQFFWLIFLEMMRVLKPHGLLYLNVPSNGSIHRYPVDCWRFYPDSGRALEAWAARNNTPTQLLESFTGDRSPDSYQSGGAWHDFVAVFVKDKAHAAAYPARMIDALSMYSNGYDSRTGAESRPVFLSPDHAALAWRDEKMGAQEQAVDALKEANTGHERTISGLEEAIGAQRQAMAGLERALAGLDEAVAAQKDALAAQHQVVAAQTEAMAAQHQVIAAQNDTIARQDQIMTVQKLADAHQAEIQARDQRIREAQLEIARLETQIEREQAAAKESRAALLAAAGESQASLARALEEARQQERAQASLAAEIGAVQARIDEILRSRSWKFMGPARKVMESTRQVRSGLRSVVRRLRSGTVAADSAVIRASGRFDESWYRSTNPDLPPRIDVIAHYCENGWREHRDPAAWFGTAAYLDANPDVRECQINPFAHYLRAGAAEGRAAHPASRAAPALRSASASALQLLALGAREPRLPATAGENLRPELASEMATIHASGMFDADYYRTEYPDIAGVPDPLRHYCENGWREGRNPSDSFNTLFYLEISRDVAAAGMNPLLHYAMAGQAEGRPARAQRPFVHAAPELAHEHRAHDGDLYGDPPEADATYRPKVSVIVPNFNHAPYLRERLESIYAQDYTNVEVILLDDCSTDNSREILLEYAQRHRAVTHTCFNELNSGGVFNQWKKALELASGELVWIAESDDYCDANYLSELVRCFRNEAVMLAFSRTQFVGESGKDIWSTEGLLGEELAQLVAKPFIRSAQWLVNRAWGARNIVPNVSSAVFRHPGRMPLLEDAAWRSLRLCGDWIFYLHLVRGGLVAFSPLATNYYRQHAQGTSFRVRKRDEYYREAEMVATQLLRLYRLEPAVLRQKRDRLYGEWCDSRGMQSRHQFDALFSIERAEAAAGLRQPNILMVGFALIAGGGETFPITLANTLKARGHSVAFLNLRYTGSEPGVRRMLDDRVPLFELERLDRVGALCDDLGIDLVHSHHAWSDMTLADVLQRHPRVKQVVTMHGMYEAMTGEALARLMPQLESSIDAVVYTAEKNVRCFSADFQARKGFTRIDNALPRKDIHPLPRPTLGIGADDFVLCLVSRAIPEKGWEEGIRAVRAARERSARTIHLVLIGEGEQYERLKPLHQGPTTHFVGFQANIRDWFAMADMGFLPSRFKGESAPLVLIDCLCSGRPMLASRLGEIPAMLQGEHGAAGVLFDLHDFSIDVGELADVVLRVVEDRAAYAAMVAEVPHAVRKFDPDVMAAKYEAVYRQVVRGGSAEVAVPVPCGPEALPPATLDKKVDAAAEENRAAAEPVIQRCSQEELQEIRRSGMFDEAYYRSQYPDVAGITDVLCHYCEKGWRERRNPSANFDTSFYLETSTDIRDAGMNPLLHYVRAGMYEGRPTGGAAERAAAAQAIRESGRFDESFYRIVNQDLQPPPGDPVVHYCETGWREGRDPCDEFSTRDYLATYPDIRQAGVNPFLHYVMSGITEERTPKLKPAPAHEDDVWFGRIESDVALVAFYTASDWAALRSRRVLPKRETPWLQPHDDVGTYEPGDRSALKRQADMARRHGIRGFCFPVDGPPPAGGADGALAAFLDAPEANIGFCPMLDARTRGEHRRALLRRACSDSRAIRVGGLPLVLAKPTGATEDIVARLHELRQELVDAAVGPVFLVACWTDGSMEPFRLACRSGACDAVLDMPDPYGSRETGGYVEMEQSPLRGVPYAVVAAQGVFRAQASEHADIPLYQALSVGRDNATSSASRRLIHKNFHVLDYRRWLDATLQAARRIPNRERRFVFLQSWNAWNEGQVLEPDRRGGYGRLNETSRALLGLDSRSAIPKVSVVVPNYNHERFLRRRLDTIYAQTYTNIEVILLDDCSTDASRTVLDEYAAAYPEITRTIYNDRNSGVAFRQWARGIKAATGDLVWIAESDDYCDERFLEVLVRKFRDEAVLLAYGQSVFVDEDGTPLDQGFSAYVSDLTCADRWNVAYLESAHREVRCSLGIKNTIPNASGVLFRRPVDMALLDDPAWLSMRVVGDWVFYLHAIRGGRVAYEPSAINYFRRYQSSTTHTSHRRETFFRELGLACRAVARLYDVPLSLLQHSRANFRLVYHRTVGGSDEEFDSWFDFEAVLRERERRLPNVVVSTMGFFPGGAEIFPIRLANEFKRQGMSVLLMSAGLHAREMGVRRLLRNDIPVMETHDLDLVMEIIDHFGIEVLNTHQWYVQNYPTSRADVFAGLAAHVATLHGMIEHGNPYSEQELRAADRNVTTWIYTADKNLGPFEDLGLVEGREARFVKFPNGIQTPVIEPVARESLDIPQDAFVLCCVSRAIADKGWPETIAAVERARGISGRDIRLVLVGNGPLHDDYLRLGVPGFVHLVGFNENSAGHYAMADMGIMLTRFRSESFPLTICDCLFAGKPYIASDVGDIRNMLTSPEGMAGGVVLLEDWEVPVDEAARMIARFATDAAAYASAKALVPQIAGRYRIESVASLYVDLFRRVLAPEESMEVLDEPVSLRAAA